MAQFDITTYSTAQMHFEQQIPYIPGGVDWIVKVLQEHKTGNMKACYVAVHDKDVSYDEDGNERAVTPHIHIAIQFDNSVKVLSVLKWFGWVEMPQLFNKAAPKARFGSLVSYLTHRTPNDGLKYQYNPEDVITIAGEPYTEALQRITHEVERAERVKHGRTDERNADEEEFLSRINPLVKNGTIAPYNKTEYITLEEWEKYKAAINKALEYKEQELALEKERDMNVLFIQGASKSGKTTVAKELACCLFGVKLRDVYISSGGKNPLDDYGGQPVIILDDLRPSDFKFNELLKLLDNDTASLIGCRYYNKSLSRCRAILITSTMPLHKWYQNVLEHDGEAIEQLSRRVQQITNVSMNEAEWTYQFEVLQPGFEYVAVQSFDEKGNKVTEYALTNARWGKSPERRFTHVTHYNKESAFDTLMSFGKESVVRESDRPGYQFRFEDINTNNEKENKNDEEPDELPF